MRLSGYYTLPFTLLIHFKSTVDKYRTQVCMWCWQTQNIDSRCCTFQPSCVTCALQFSGLIPGVFPDILNSRLIFLKVAFSQLQLWVVLRAVLYSRVQELQLRCYYFINVWYDCHSWCSHQLGVESLIWRTAAVIQDWLCREEVLDIHNDIYTELSWVVAQFYRPSSFYH